MCKIAVICSGTFLQRQQSIVFSLLKEKGIGKGSVEFIETNVDAERISHAVHDLDPEHVFGGDVPEGMMDLYRQKIIALNPLKERAFIHLERKYPRPGILDPEKVKGIKHICELVAHLKVN